MLKNKSFIAIIPARAGSKRLPRKNLIKINNKPLIAYTIYSALKSKYIDKVIVSSDSKLILDTSRRYGADILKRPKFLAKDNSSSYEVVEHTIKNFKSFEYIVLLQPTSPLRDENIIDKAINFLDKKNADAIISVCKSDHNPNWYNQLPTNMSMKNFFNDQIRKKTSKIKDYYRLNGAIYICKTEKLLKEKNFFLKDKIYAFEMSRNKSIDIDTNLDLILARHLLTK